MLKKTLLASTLTLGLFCAASSVQANPMTNVISGFVNGFVNDIQLDARRGGGFRRSSPTTTKRYSSSSTSSSRAVTTTNNRSSSTSSNTNNANTNRNQQQQDAQFSQNAYRGTPNNNNAALGNSYYANRGTTGGLGMGSTFLSSLAGAGAGVLLANMLLTPTAAAAQGTEVATPDMLSDDQIKECLAQLDTDLKDAEAQLADATGDEAQALRDQISQMHNLQISLMKEQLNRLQGATNS
ncbi:MAG: hypothetical protein H9847_05300 [Candidatus Anaerobiospirillum pullicola]|uniref:Uncharacterized protein n=1 Tax=Candidatus Anaerobiospirillum pullicola TaxID=2838451 RepID=A0A948WXY4_9GAMM|nr:hypothetical protein [Candidatus Anaerobiospirillum pullicola]